MARQNTARAPEAEAADAAPTHSTITVQGMTVHVPHTYREGHVLTAGEASHLEQVLRENLRNNFSAKVKKHRKEHGLNDNDPLPEDHQEQLRQQFAEYAGSYKLEARAPGVGRGPTDPVERTVHQLASTIVRAALKKKGYNAEQIKSFNEDGTFEKLVAGAIEKRPDIREEAIRRVQANQAIAAETIDI